MIETPLNRGVWQAWNDRQPEEAKQDYHEWAAGKIETVVPLGRWQQPEDVADMAVFPVLGAGSQCHRPDDQRRWRVHHALVAESLSCKSPTPD